MEKNLFIIFVKKIFVLNETNKQQQSEQCRNLLVKY